MSQFKGILFWVTITAAVFFGSQILSSPLPCLAQGSVEDVLSEEIGRIDSEASKDAGKVEEALMGQFGVQKEEIQSYLNDKISYGNIAALLATSSASGKPKQDVLGLLKSGKKWEEISGQLGADPGAIVAQVQEVGKKLGGEAAAKPKRKMKFAPGT